MGLLQEKLSLFTAADELKEQGIYPYHRSITSEQDSQVVISGKKVLMFGSNSYLGLTNHPKVKEAAIAAIKKYGTGCAGSRFLNGSLDIHSQLEERLAKFVGKDEAIMFSTGFQVNLGVVSCLTGKGDYIILDERDHASIIEGRRLSFANYLKFKHNDMESLEKMLQKCEPDKIKLIVVDSVFSMEGDVAPLKEITALAKKYNASVMADEAHGIGVFGPHGEGVCHAQGVTDDVDLIMATFSKSFASLGGFIATDHITADFIRHTARSYMFSASATPAAVGAANAALDIMLNEPERIQHLWDLTNMAIEGFRNMGCEIGNTSSPIIPLFIRNNEKTFAVTMDLMEEGLFVNPVVSPGVPPDDTLIRFSLMATHTKKDIEIALDKIEKVFKRYDII
ncbi:MAG: aminotransferase class I/II-fold pyridoxal phosphate-dependent enzyme [Bacteroidales bacterium]|nr:aminotransferase class I/II-fold pyridoxal phosphate-dependent enzyme [Bacteroidales bacterium]